VYDCILIGKPAAPVVALSHVPMNKLHDATKRRRKSGTGTVHLGRKRIEYCDLVPALRE
jgi:hypothetical protein